MTGAALHDALRAIVGSAGLLTGEDMAAHVRGARYGDGKAAAVVRPARVEEVAAVVAFCASEGIPLVPQGANTGLVGASTPDGSGQQLVLSLSRLRQRCEIDLVNRTVDVDAGVLLHELNERLEPHGLWFPVDLAADPSIGGMIATNTGGTRLLRYGDVRRNLLAVEAVLFDPPGRLARFGAPLRKNNTGFDLRQLFVGTSGAAGVITGATLDLAPRPRQAVTALLVPHSDAAVAPLLLAAEQQLGDFLSAFEGISRNALQAALHHVPALRNPFESEQPEFVLLVEVASAAAPDPQGIEVEQLLLQFLERQLGSTINDAVLGRGNELWHLRHALSDGARALGRVIGFDISVRRGDIMRFRREAAALVSESGLPLAVVDFGHVGDGGLHFNLVWPYQSAERYDAGRVQHLRDTVYELVVSRFGGSFSAEHGLGPHNHACYLEHTPPVTLALSGRLQQLLDPRGTSAAVRLGPAASPA